MRNSFVHRCFLTIGSVLIFCLCLDVKATSLSDDHVELIELSHRYALGIDTMDREVLADVFTEDATAHYKEVGSDVWGFNVELSTFENIYDWLHRSIGDRKRSSSLPGHFMSNHVVEISGDTANMEFYMHNRSMKAGGIYYTRAIRTADGWRIQSLRLEEQFWNIEDYRKRSDGPSTRYNQH